MLTINQLLEQNDLIKIKKIKSFYKMISFIEDKLGSNRSSLYVFRRFHFSKLNIAEEENSDSLYLSDGQYHTMLKFVSLNINENDYNQLNSFDFDILKINKL